MISRICLCQILFAFLVSKGDFNTTGKCTIDKLFTVAAFKLNQGIERLQMQMKTDGNLSVHQRTNF
ncbi:hypothetical protein T07_3528 [Trichinella nelsoni]|uniref:Secreted protein n=1 Tax=Trichinella nelsoni TaxID=6336 RepID=A0A0V0S6S7_9BILA|nr:hypothetical protein T07_3528 [Trichinella nelsoni]